MGPITYQQARRRPSKMFNALAALAAVAFVASLGALYLVHGNDRGPTGALLLAFSPVAVVIGLYSVGPRGALDQLWVRPGSVALDADGMSWILDDGRTGRAEWAGIGGIEVRSGRGTSGAIVMDIQGQEIIRVPEDVKEPVTGRTRSIVDLVLEAHPDRYEPLHHLYLKACVLRPPGTD